MPEYIIPDPYKDPNDNSSDYKDNIEVLLPPAFVDYSDESKKQHITRIINTRIDQIKDPTSIKIIFEEIKAAAKRMGIDLTTNLLRAALFKASVKTYTIRQYLIEENSEKEYTPILEKREEEQKDNKYDINYDSYTEGQILRENQHGGLSDFGTVIYDEIIFCGDADYDNDVDNITTNGRPLVFYKTIYSDTKKKYEVEKQTLLPVHGVPAYIDISVDKNIKTFEPIGLNTKIFQNLNRGTQNISAKLIISSIHSDVFPGERVQKLKEYFESNVEIRIVSYVFQEIFGINHVIVNNYRFYTEEGSRNICYCDLELKEFKKPAVKVVN